MVLGAVAGCALLGQLLGAGWAGAPQQASAVAASLCSSYVGGSINFVAVSQVWKSVGCRCGDSRKGCGHAWVAGLVLLRRVMVLQ